MSRVDNVEVSCPTCNQKFETPIWRSLNTVLNPAEKDLLLSDKLFIATCPKCHAESPIIYPILYHDMTNRVMIQLVLSEEDAEVLLNARQAIEASPAMSSLLYDDSKLRFVENHDELREKAMIFDCGLDDRVVELIKYHYSVAFSKAHPDIQIDTIFFQKDTSSRLIFLTKQGAMYTIDFDMMLYDEVSKTRKNVIEEKSKDCFYINREWALDLIKKDGIYNENLPFLDVHHGKEYMGFSDGRSENTCLCLCQKQSIENRVKIFMRYYQYDSCLNPRNKMLLSFLGLPQYFEDKITESRVPFGEEWLSFLQYSREICHICNKQKPDYQYSIYAHDSDIKKQYGHYQRSRYFHYGLDDMEYWGVYFIEEALLPEYKKLLCPQKDELAMELRGFDDETDKLFALPKDQFEVLLYSRTKAKALREKGMLSDSHLFSALGFTREFENELHAIIHKRFLAVRKSIRDEFKRMLPKTAAALPSKKKK